MAKMTIEGFDEFEKKLNSVAEKAEELANQTDIKYEDLFDNGFLKAHTKFATFSEMMENSGFRCETQEEFDNIPENEFDQFITKISKYNSFKEMVMDAYGEYASEKLGI